MSYRWQNDHNTKWRAPSYYAGNKQYPQSGSRLEVPGRTSRRVHDGLSIDRNYGLDTTSDDINSSPYSSPYYINGRYNSDNLTTQRGNSASIQGTEFLNSYGDVVSDFSSSDVQTTIEMWQGKQIKFEIPYSGKVVGNTITLKNTGGCTGILSIYFSTRDGGEPIYETAIDLKTISKTTFQHKTLRSITTFPANAGSKIYVRMEIWDEIKQDRVENPFNTGRKIEIAATGLDNHSAAVVKLGEKNAPVTETYDYTRLPNRPCIGLIYNEWTSVPVNRTEAAPTGASVSKNGVRYDVFCIKKSNEAKVLIYDKSNNTFVNNTNIAVNKDVKKLDLVQAEDSVYYVDGVSRLQKFQIGTWVSSQMPLPTECVSSVDLATWQASPLGSTSGVYTFVRENGTWKYAGNSISLSSYGITLSGGTPPSNCKVTVTYTAAGSGGAADIASEYSDSNPVNAPSLITFHNNRIYISGFAADPNLVQFTEIVAAGPDFDSYPYRFYAPDESPLSTSTNPITSLIEYASDTLMITGKTFFSLFRTDGSSSGATAETSMPSQVSTFTDGGGIQSNGDICNYRGVMYSFDTDEGIRRFTGSVWNSLPNQIRSYWERVDMSKPRKLWGYSSKLYLNYTDVVTGKYMCIIWDMDMNYQSYPFFCDMDLPFCDIRFDDDFDLLGIHPDYPCIMQLYAEEVWRRLDTPITFERHTKFQHVPGNAADMILKRVHNKVIANDDRWWWFGLVFDKHYLEQTRSRILTYRIPCWDTKVEQNLVEDAFNNADIYEEDATSMLSINNIRAQAISVQIRIKCRTFRSQANLVSTLLEIQTRNYI